MTEPPTVEPLWPPDLAAGVPDAPAVATLAVFPGQLVEVRAGRGTL